MFAMCFLLGIIAAALHAPTSFRKLAAGYPKFKDAILVENEPMSWEESRAIGKAFLGVGFVFGLTAFILCVYRGMRFYFAIIVALIVGWLLTMAFFLIFGLIVRFKVRK